MTLTAQHRRMIAAALIGWYVYRALEADAATTGEELERLAADAQLAAAESPRPGFNPCCPDCAAEDARLELTERQRLRFEGAAERGRAERFLGLLRGVVVASDRLRDQWAESDEARQQELWRALAAASTAAEEVVYPLPAEEPADG